MTKPNNIVFAFWLNLVFSIIELVGAFMTNSVAIASDAIHDLGDSFALGLSWYLERYSGKGRDEHFSFGYKRFSLLAALLNCLILILGSLLILREALPRLWEPQAVEANGMIWLAIVGIMFNGYGAWRLHQGHSHNETVLSLHFLEDVLGWVAVLIVAFAMKLGDYAFLDPLLSIGIALFILWNACKRLKGTLRIFLQSIPDNVDMTALEQSMRSVLGVSDVHDIHVWSLDGRHHVLSAHVRLQPEASSVEVKKMLKNLLRQQGIEHLTLEME